MFFLDTPKGNYLNPFRGCLQVIKVDTSYPFTVAQASFSRAVLMQSGGMLIRVTVYYHFILLVALSSDSQTFHMPPLLMDFEPMPQ